MLFCMNCDEGIEIEMKSVVYSTDSICLLYEISSHIYFVGMMLCQCDFSLDLLFILVLEIFFVLVSF